MSQKVDLIENKIANHGIYCHIIMPEITTHNRYMAQCNSEKSQLPTLKTFFRYLKKDVSKDISIDKEFFHLNNHFV